MRAALLACLLLAPGAACRSRDVDPAPSERRMAERLPDSPGLEGVSRIHGGLYRGSQPDPETGYPALRGMGIRTVINLRWRHDFEGPARAAGLDYVAIPIRADIVSTPPTDDQVRAFFDVVLDPSRHPVYFHCLHGEDRTGTMAALYRIEVDGWTNEQAIEEMDAFGYHDYYRDLKRFVRGYRRRGFADPPR